MALWETNGNRYAFQNINQNTPFTLTQVTVDRDDGKNTFNLLQTYQTVSGLVQEGRLISAADIFGIKNLAKAFKNVDWDWLFVEIIVAYEYLKKVNPYFWLQLRKKIFIKKMEIKCN